MVFLFASKASADQPWATSVDGRLFQAGTSNPLKDPTLSFTLQILNPGKDCVLYEETQVYDTNVTNGYFSLKVGSAAPDLSGRRTANDPGYTMSRIFNNTLNSFPSAAGCSGGYSPADGDARYLRVAIDPTSGASEVLSPDIALNSVPSAKVAETVGGLSRAELLQVNTTGVNRLDQTNLLAVFNTTQLPILTALLGGTSSLYMRQGANGAATLPGVAGNASSAMPGQIWYDTASNSMKYQSNLGPQVLGVAGAGITGVTAGTGLNVGAGPGGTISTSGTLNIDVGSGVGQIVQVQAGGKLPAVSGADLTNLNGSAINSGTIGGTASINTSGTIQSGAITSSGSITGTTLSATGAISGASVATTGAMTAASLTTTGSVSSSDVRTNSVKIFKPSTLLNVELVADAALSSSLVFTLPTTLGSNGQVLQVDNAGKMSWTTISGTAPGGSAGGDLGGNYPNPDVIKVRGNAVASGTLAVGDTGKIYRWSGTQFEAVNFGVDDLKTESGLSQFATNCNSNQTLTWSAITDGFACTTIALNANQITAGTIDAARLPVVGIDKGGTGLSAIGTANQVLGVNAAGTAAEYKAITAGAGVTVSHSAGGIQISAPGTGGTVTSVTGSGPIGVATGATTPVISISQATTTTDGFLSSTDWNTFNNKQAAGNYLLNSGGTPSISSAAEGSRPAAGTAGRLFVATDTHRVFRDTGAVWEQLSINASDLMAGTLPIGRLPAFTGDVTSSAGSNSMTLNTVPLTKGGTGLTSGGTGNQVLGMNNLGTAAEFKNIVGGSGVTITPTAGTLTITATGSGGTVTNITAGTGLNVGAGPGGSITGTGTLNIDVGTTTGKIIQVAASNKLPVIDGSNLTDLNASNLSSGTLPTGRLPAFTGDVTSSAGSNSLTLGTVPINKGGTGQVTANASLNALLPSQTSASGRVLQSNGTDASWVVPNAGTVTSVSGSGPISVLTGTTTPAISIALADTATDGYISATDWNTFNNKASTAALSNYVLKAGDTMTGTLVVPTVYGSTANAGDLSIDSTSHATKGNLALNPSSTTGTVSIGNSSGAWPNKFSVFNSGADLINVNRISNTVGAAVNINFSANNASSVATYYGRMSGLIEGNTAASENGSLALSTTRAGTMTEAVRILASGNVGIGTTGPTEKLEVAGKVKATELCIGADCRSVWPTGAGGSVTSVTSANTDISVATTTTTPVLTLNTGTGPDQIVKLNGSSQLPSVSGVNLTNLNASNLASGTLPAARLPAFAGDVTSAGGTASLTLNTVPVNKGGTASTTFNANQIVVSNGTGTALQSFDCPIGNVLKFNASGVAACDTIAGILGYTPANSANYVAKAGDTMTGTLNLPSNGLVVGANQLVVNGGSVGVGTASSDASAALDVSSTTKGFLPPRMTTAQRTAIASPAAGLIVFDTTDGFLYIRRNSTWVKMTDSTEVSFHVTKTSDQTMSATTQLINWQTTVRDVGSSFDLTTDRFQPTVPGLYMIHYSAYTPGLNAGSYWQPIIYKNGVTYAAKFEYAAAATNIAVDVSAIVPMNGTTDYLTFVVNSGQIAVIDKSVGLTFAQGFLISGGTGGGGGGSDNLGNHSMSQNLVTSGNWISGDGGNEGIAVNAVGNVGIGTSSPGVPLDVVGDVRTSTAFYAPISYIAKNLGNSNSASGPAFSFVYSSDTGMYEGDSAGSHVLAFSTAGSERLRISATGNVGIGLNNPSEKLEVTGKVKATELCIGADCRSVWPSAGTGTVTNITAGTGLNVGAGPAGSITTTGTLNIDVGTTTGKIVQVAASNKLPAIDGSNLTNLTPANLSATVPVNKGGTASTSFTGNTLVATDGTGSSLMSWTCPIGQIIKFDSGGVLGCDTIANVLGYTPANGTNFVAKAGDTMTGTLSLASNGLVVGTNQLAVSGGAVGVGTASPSSSAVLDASSTTKGFLPPRMTTAQRNAISSPAAGLTVYNSDEKGLNYYDGANWQSLNGELRFLRLTMSAIQNPVTDSVIAFDTIGASNGMTSASNGIQLKAGRTYRLEATIDLHATGSAGGNQYLGYKFHNGTSYFGQPAFTFINTTATGDQRTSNSSLLEFFTPSVDTTVTVRSYTLSLADAQIYNLWGTKFVATEVRGGPGSNAGGADNMGNHTASQNIVLGANWLSGDGGSEGIYVNAAGNVGVGTGSPSTRFHVSGGPIKVSGTSTGWFAFSDSSNAANFGTFLRSDGVTALGYIGGGGGAAITGGAVTDLALRSDSNLLFATGNAERVRIDTSGNVGIGVTNPTVKLDVSGTARATISEGSNALSLLNASNGGAWNFRLQANGSTANNFHIDNTNLGGNALTIKSNGNLGIGTTDPSSKLHVIGDAKINSIYGGESNGAGNFHLDAWTSGSTRGMYLNWFSGPGGIHAGNGAGWYGPMNASAFNVNSDRRLKRDIQSIPDALQKIDKISGVTFYWNEKSAGPERQVGVIAQDVQAVMPELVSVNKQTQKLTVNYSGLVAPLIEAVKELYKKWSGDSKVIHAELQEKEARIKALESSNAELKAALCELNPKSKICPKQK